MKWISMRALVKLATKQLAPMAGVKCLFVKCYLLALWGKIHFREIFTQYSLHSCKVTAAQYCVSNRLGRKDDLFQVPKLSQITTPGH